MVKRAVFAVPGSLDTPTGGYAYDKRIMAELRQVGWDVEALDIGDGFPLPDEATRIAARDLLLAIPDGQPIVIDGLALGVLPDIAAEAAKRHPLLGLVHHPLALEWGLSAERADALRHSERTALASAREVVVTSPATAKLVASDYGVATERITVARPGNDPAPRARGSRERVPHLLSVGAITPRKGFDVLVAALATLAELPWRLTIAGDLTRDPDEAARLQAAISEHELSDRIAVLGAISSERLAALYDETDVFVLASHFEGYGMAYSEALSRGLPVIGTMAGAIPDTVPPAAGVLVPPGNVPELAGALRGMIADKELRRCFSDGAFASAAVLPTWQQSGAIFAAVLARLS